MVGFSEHHGASQLWYERSSRKQSSGMPKNKIWQVSLPSSLGSSSNLMLIQVVPRLSALCLPSLHSNSDLARCCRQVSKVLWVDIARLGFCMKKGCRPRRPYFFAPNNLPLDLSIR